MTADEHLLAELRAVGCGCGPWMLAADLGVPMDASLRSIAYLYVSALDPALDPVEPVEAVLDGFAQYLVIVDEAEAIDFR